MRRTVTGVSKRVRRKARHVNKRFVQPRIPSSSNSNQPKGAFQFLKSSPIVIPRKATNAGYERVLVERIAKVCDALGESSAVPMDADRAIQHLAETYGATTEARQEATWLVSIALTGRLPSRTEFDLLDSRLQFGDPLSTMRSQARATAVHQHGGWDRSIELVSSVLVDVTHTARNDVNTGIQRVVRELAPRWVAANPETCLAVFDEMHGGWRGLSPVEQDRTIHWTTYRKTLGTASAIARGSNRQEGPDKPLLVPWHATILTAEIVGRGRHSEVMATAADCAPNHLGMVVHDLIPYFLPEFVSNPTRLAFGDSFTVIKSANRVSCVSNTVASGLGKICEHVSHEQGHVPEVKAQPLPSNARSVREPITPALRKSVLGSYSDVPLVLSVSSLEPRKNHRNSLIAAELLWQQGHEFQLLYISGNKWKHSSFTGLLKLLQAKGRPVRVVERASDEFLNAAYQLARFTVFVSLSEGYGLPVVESLAFDTPVVVSGIGSMREISEGGGTRTVDPRDVSEISAAMLDLLVNDDAIEVLRKESAAKPLNDWDSHAADVLEWLLPAN